MTTNSPASQARRNDSLSDSPQSKGESSLHPLGYENAAIEDAVSELLARLIVATVIAELFVDWEPLLARLFP